MWREALTHNPIVHGCRHRVHPCTNGNVVRGGIEPFVLVPHQSGPRCLSAPRYTYLAASACTSPNGRPASSALLFRILSLRLRELLLGVLLSGWHGSLGESPVCPQDVAKGAGREGTPWGGRVLAR